MALDIEKLRKSAQEVQARMNRGGGPSLKYWKPQEGKNVIRVLPAWTEEGEFADCFWREVHQHWNVGGEESTGPVTCPKKTPGASEDKECPICDLVDTLRARKNDVEAQELVKNIRAKVTYLMSIVDLGDPIYTAKDVGDWKKDRPDSDCPFEAGQPKVQCYASTSTIYEQIANIVLANEMDITDRDAGHNIVLTKIGNKDKLKTRYTVTPDLKKTKAPITADYVMPDLSKMGKISSYDELVKLLGAGPASSFVALPATAGKSSTGSATDTSTAWGMETVDNDGGDLAAQMRAELKS